MVQSRSLLFGRWPRFIARHPWRVLLGAVLLLVVLGGVSTAANGKFADQFSIPGTEAQQAQDLLQSRFPQAAGDSTTVVIKAPAGIRTQAISRASGRGGPGAARAARRGERQLTV